MKPRIRQLAANLWVCSAWWSALDGFGKTPIEAFNDWKERRQNEA